MITHINFVNTADHASLLRNTLQNLETGVDSLTKLLGTMTRCIDGDGSDPAQFGEVVARFGFGSTADAKAAWDELNSLNFKLNTDNTVDHVSAALHQVFDKFR